MAALKGPREIAGAGAVLAVASAAGWTGARLGVPLAWVLGPMTVTAAASIAGVRVLESKRLRQFGQLVVGSGVGLNVTAAAVAHMVFWLPAMLATAAAAMLLAALLSVPFARAARVDRVTAFFSLTPGGLTEMANVGRAEGAKPETIALAQAIRVALLVGLMPPLITTFGLDGGLPSPLGPGTVDPAHLLLLLAAAFVCAQILRRLGANNAWMVGALVGGGLLSGFAIVEGRMPYPLFAAAQFLIGIAIGARFRRENVRKLPRVFAVVPVFVVLLSGLLFGWAVLLWALTGFDLSSATLASSPGGLSEMSLTAQALHLDVALITAFHVVRSFFVNGFTLHAYRLLGRLGVFRLMERIVGRGPE